MKAIDNIRKAADYWRVMKDDYDSDFGGLLRFERKKLERMRDWYSTHEVKVVDRSYVLGEVNLALRLLDIIDESHDGLEQVEGTDIDWFGRKQYSIRMSVYVNTRNERRFLSVKDGSVYDSGSESWKAIRLSDLRWRKAWHCYNLLREVCLMWWCL